MDFDDLIEKAAREHAAALSKRGVGADLSDDDELAFESIRFLQAKFQREYCSSCKHHGPDGFLHKGHTNDPQDCRYHWTDMLGTCWNYRKA